MGRTCSIVLLFDAQICDLSSKAGRCRLVHVPSCIHELFARRQLENTTAVGVSCVRKDGVVLSPNCVKQEIFVASTSLKVGLNTAIPYAVHHQLENQIRTLNLHMQLEIKV